MTTIAVVFRTVGWVLASFGYNSIIGSLPAGPITDLVRTLDLVLTPQVGVLHPFCHENIISRFQAIAQTLARDALRTVWDLAARIITTATLFGVFESVEKQINHCHFLMFFLGFSNCGKHNHRRTLEIHHGRKNRHSHGFKVLFYSISSLCTSLLLGQ